MIARFPASPKTGSPRAPWKGRLAHRYGPIRRQTLTPGLVHTNLVAHLSALPNTPIPFREIACATHSDVHRRRLLALLGSAALALAGAIALPGTAQAANVLTNPGFESGSLSPWTCTGNLGSVVSSPVHGGAKALQGAVSSSDNAQCSQTVAVQPNTTYALSGWVRGSLRLPRRERRRLHLDVVPVGVQPADRRPSPPAPRRPARRSTSTAGTPRAPTTPTTSASTGPAVAAARTRRRRARRPGWPPPARRRPACRWRGTPRRTTWASRRTTSTADRTSPQRLRHERHGQRARRPAPPTPSPSRRGTRPGTPPAASNSVSVTTDAGGGGGTGFKQAAPYLYEGWGDPPSPSTVMSATGIKWFTMAFVLDSGGCTPAWDGSRALTGGVDQTAINQIRSAGGDIVPSFGGWRAASSAPTAPPPSALAGRPAEGDRRLRRSRRSTWTSRTRTSSRTRPCRRRS